MVISLNNAEFYDFPNDNDGRKELEELMKDEKVELGDNDLENLA